MSKGSNTTTTQSGPNPTAGAAYDQLLQRAGQVASTPYQAYGGELVAGMNQQQQLGIGGINQYANAAQPYLQTAAGYAQQAAQPLTQQQIQQYQSPYTQDVVNATESQFNNQNAQQQQQVLGNAAAQGALGGDRTAVAQSVLAGQQQTQEAPVIAGLENTGYQTGLQTAEQQQQNMAQGAYNLSNVGNSIQNAGLMGANAQIGAGTMQQQTQQAQDTAAYQQFMQAQQYPYAQLGWLAGIDTGVGSQMGGQSTTTGPQPNQTAQYLGLGLGALGMFMNRGGKVQHFDVGGGAMPYGTPGIGWVPQVSITGGGGPPKAPAIQSQQSSVQSPMQLANQATQLASSLKGKGTGALSGLFGGGSQSMSDSGSAVDLMGGADSVSPVASSGVSFDNDVPQFGFRRGGPIRAGLGMASFMPRRRFAAGGGDDSDGDVINFPSDRFVQPPVPAGLYNNSSGEANPVENILKFQTYGLNSPYVPSHGSSATAKGTATDQGDDDSLPPQITGRPQQAGIGTSGFAFQDDGSRNASVVAPPDSVNAAPAPAARSAGDEEKGGIHFGLGLMSPDAKSALLAAGLGMMASRSPFLGNAIGEGGLAGLQAYGGLKKQEQDVDLKVRQLNQAAKAEQDRIALETKKEADQYSKMTPYQTAELAQKQEQEEYQRSLPKTVNDPIFGQRTIVQRPDKTWVYADTGEPMLPSDADKVQTPTSAAPSAVPSAPPSQANPTAQPSQPAAATDDPARPFKNAQPSSATMTRAMQMGLHGQAFLDAVPLPLRNTLESIGNYDEPETVFSKMGRAGIPQDRAIAFVRQFNPEYNSYWAQANRSSLREFLSGGPNSPAAQIRSYNTAIGHAGDAWDALQQMKTINPGFLQQAQNAGIPFVSYAASQLQNRAIQGTPMGAALNKYITAMTLYGAETSKLYSGSAGSQEEKNTIRAPLDPAKSIQEIEAGLGMSAHMMGSRSNALEDQYKVAQNAPGLAQYGTKGEIKDFPVLHERSKAILEKIGANQGGGGARPLTPQDQQAMAWANANPKDPRAAQIKQRLGVQ